jgi:hypothetical protein
MEGSAVQNRAVSRVSGVPQGEWEVPPSLASLASRVFGGPGGCTQGLRLAW